MLKKLLSSEQPEAEQPRRGASATAYKRAEKSKTAAKESDPARIELAWMQKLKGIDGDWWLKPATILTALAVFVALADYSYGVMYNWLDQPVEQVVFEGQTRHLDRHQLAASSVALMGGGLLSADLEAVKEGIQANPWVYQVGVTRRWPAALYLQVTEEVPVARWGSDGLLNHEGDIFWPEQLSRYSGLPLLTGPSGNTAMMMSEYYDLNQMLRSAGLQLVELKLEARGAWTLILDNDIRIIVGRDQVVARLERFLKIYTQRLQAEAKAGRIEQIDIRYNNGIAVKWRPQVSTEEQQKG
ncbi:MAG: cell division protein FtsQ/DivIB [Amphritea sp.]|nr:cell division protein FtsQ/DivIB [Amphritea sp.]